ncbi:GIY-YIG nuclease family protein [Sporosarcina cascadiensis]|uniref:GIY-YIG nuclease family protein n=1 Tax=Sporosarcina cascadiensis TaxID=2660747 RepID=UPI001E63E101|nr:GIY-YIG nuclease family protein [Sporosarcina cascadiensis]
MSKNKMKQPPLELPAKKNKEEYNQLSWFMKTWSWLLILFSLLAFVIPHAILLTGPIIGWKLRKAIKQNNKLFIKYEEIAKIVDDRILKLDALDADIEITEQKITSHKEELAAIQEDIINNKEIFGKLKTEFKNDVREEMKEQISEATNEAAKIRETATNDAANVLIDVQKYIEERDQLLIDNEKAEKQLKTNTNKILKAKAEILGIKTLTENFPNALNYSKLEKEVRNVSQFFDEESMLRNLIELDCHYKNSKELRKEMNRNKRELKKVLDTYVDRYTTKANKTIYQLMVIGLQAELQNILYTLTYSKLEEAQENVRDLVRRYLAICADGNNSILPTITRFLSEIEPIFLEAIEIEHHYYAKRELEKEEQQAIREQMRQDAAEKKALKEQQKKLEQEEEKFMVEMQRNMELLLSETDTDKISVLEARVRELEEQQNELELKKEEITRLANGKAGYVYVISNLGSFGDQMFKVGMTRRLNPQERVDELGSASVPFKFDVHAMVFSNDAVGLENQLHQTLHQQRVNKVNLRKEFFNTTIEKLQEIVEEIDPTVEFKTTLLAQEYFKSKELKEEKLSNVG